jgi:hybrid cluster-associated redox disulfide protein
MPKCQECGTRIDYGRYTIDELARRVPAAADVLIRRRMHCVGCDMDRFHTVGDVCCIYGQPLTILVSELRQVAA